MVSEQESQSQATAGGRTRKTENGSQTYAAASFRDFFSSGCARPRILRGVAPFPEALAASFPRGTLRRTRRIQYVPPRLTGTEDETVRYRGYLLRGPSEGVPSDSRGDTALNRPSDCEISVTSKQALFSRPSGLSTALDFACKFTHCEIKIKKND